VESHRTLDTLIAVGGFLISDLENLIGYQFKDERLIRQALTHRSTHGAHMERLEFLGDAVLGLIIAARLYEQFTHVAEGEMTRMRAVLVCKNGLLAIADKWHLALHIQVGEGERDKAGHVKSTSIVANAVEAVIGAVFLDGGWEAVRLLVLNAWKDSLQDADQSETRDAKTRLQEFTQAHGLGLPAYKVRDLGGDAHIRFAADCFVNDEKVGTGAGERKKIAEIEAADHACQHFLKA